MSGKLRSFEILNQLESEGQLCGDESEVNWSSGGCCGAGGAVSGAAMGPVGSRGAATVSDGKVVARCQGRGGEWSVVPLVVGSGDQTHGG